jgi:hypothetical protein
MRHDVVREAGSIVSRLESGRKRSEPPMTCACAPSGMLVVMTVLVKW